MIISRFFRFSILAGLVLSSAALARAQQLCQTWLLLNPESQETLLVTDPVERNRLTNNGWKINGSGAFLLTPQADTMGVQRWVKGFDKGNDRIFATTPEQAAAAQKAGYNNEGVMGRVAATQLTPKMIPVYQFTKDWRSLWLIDKADQAWAEKNGWKLKGPAFWIWPKPGA